MQTRTPLIILIVALILAIGGVAIFLFMQKGGPSGTFGDVPNPDQYSDGTYQEDLKLPPPPPEPAEVFAYSGTITSIDESAGTVTFSTEYGLKTVTITASTQIVERRRPTREERLRLNPDQVAAALQNEQPYQGALAIDDIITAMSGVNIRGATTYQASKIIITH